MLTLSPGNLLSQFLYRSISGQNDLLEDEDVDEQVNPNRFLTRSLFLLIPGHKIFERFHSMTPVSGSKCVHFFNLGPINLKTCSALVLPIVTATIDKKRTSQ